MDERTITSAENATARHLEQALQNIKAPRTYSVVVLDKNGNKPFPVTASSADERAEAMADAGVDLRVDKWAAGHLDLHRNMQICGNNDEAKRLVENHLRHRH